jgi:hypothetical protein
MQDEKCCGTCGSYDDSDKFPPESYGHCLCPLPDVIVDRFQGPLPPYVHKTDHKYCLCWTKRKE